MKLILCVDDNGGVAFNHRRQSRDRVLNEHILALCGMHRLWITPYTAKLFGEDTAAQLCVAEDCLAQAGEEDFCFAELTDPTPYLERAQQVILYHWNRTYPADVHFTLPKNGWSRQREAEFTGSSHEKITEEVFIKCEN